MANLKASNKMPDTTGWKHRHNTALVFPEGAERPIVHLLQAWNDYAIEYKRHYDGTIGEDGVLGPAWQDIGTSIRTMLNGELKRLDGGTLDAYILDTLAENGVDTSAL